MLPRRFCYFARRVPKSESLVFDTGELYEPVLTLRFYDLKYMTPRKGDSIQSVLEMVHEEALNEHNKTAVAPLYAQHKRVTAGAR